MNITSYILVTGGSGGIGSALCKLLPERGFAPIVGYHVNKAMAETIARECNGFTLKIDMGSEESVKEALDQLSNELSVGQNLSGVVLAASPPPELLSFGKLTAEILLNQFRVNVLGPQVLLSGLIKAFFKNKRSGFVVGVLSKAIGNETQPPMTGMGGYIISKMALRGMLSLCAAEYPWLKVSTISPGFTKTRMLDVFDKRYLDLAQEKTQFASAEDVARQILNEIQI